MNESLKHVTSSQVVLVMDYSENYHVAFQNKLQSAYFEPVQITIHPMMLYTAPIIFVKHAIIGISNDVKHDGSGVKCFVQAALDFLLHIFISGLMAVLVSTKAQLHFLIPCYNSSSPMKFLHYFSWQKCCP